VRSTGSGRPTCAGHQQIATALRLMVARRPGLALPRSVVNDDYDVQIRLMPSSGNLSTISRLYVSPTRPRPTRTGRGAGQPGAGRRPRASRQRREDRAHGHGLAHRPHDRQRETGCGHDRAGLRQADRIEALKNAVSGMNMRWPTRRSSRQGEEMEKTFTEFCGSPALRHLHVHDPGSQFESLIHR